MSTANLTFYSVGKKGTVRTTGSYDPEKAVEILYRSMKGLGTDEDAIIDVVATHTFQQRQELKQLYKQKYGKDLIKELDSELSFSFSKTVLALMKRPEHFIIECIHQAISKSRAARLLKQLQKIYRKGMDSDEYSLLELLCPRSNDELESIKILYKKKYEKELEDDIGFDLGEDLRSLILDMISGGRECDTEIDTEKVIDDADNLHGAALVPVGEICGTKERVLQQIFNTRSYEHLRHLIPAYEETSNRSIEDYIDGSELSLDLKNAYQTIVKLLRNEPNYYAERLREAIRGLGTDDDTLISIIVLRSEIDLKEIMLCYLNKYGKSLHEDVIGDTSGDYCHILLKILNFPAQDEVLSTERKLSSAPVLKEENNDEEEEHLDQLIEEHVVDTCIVGHVEEHVEEHVEGSVEESEEEEDEVTITTAAADNLEEVEALVEDQVGGGEAETVIEEIQPVVEEKEGGIEDEVLVELEPKEDKDGRKDGEEITVDEDIGVSGG